MRGLMGLVLVGACYHPSPALDVPCGPEGACPIGQTCDTAQSPPLCVATRFDASLGDVDQIDAAIDATIDATPVSCAGGCPSSLPVCDAGSGTCRGCVQDSECPSDVCHEAAGTCTDESAALYVAPGAGPTACLRAAPCGTVSHALTQLTSTITTIKVAAGSYSDAWVMPSFPPTVIISGPASTAGGATIIFNGSAPVSHVAEVRTTNSTLALEGMTLIGATSECVRGLNAGIAMHWMALSNCGGGIRLDNTNAKIVSSAIDSGGGIGVRQSGNAMTMDRTIVTGGGGPGIQVNGGKFTITNSMIVANSSGDGLAIENSVDSSSSLDFVTIASNAGSGINNSTATGFTIRDTIIARNEFPSVGPVTTSYSLSDGTLFGINNVLGDPMFIDSTSDFHIQFPSPARNAADPGSTMTIDFDGDPRPLGPGRDIGADEIP